MDFRIRQLESFLTLSSMLNFGRASEALYITQPALTLQIQGLEEVFGVKLFERTNQQVTLTREGKAFVGHARFIIQQVKEAHNELNLTPERLYSRISCGEAGALGIVPHILRRLAVTYPQFILEQLEYDVERQVEALLGGRLDALLMQVDLSIEGAKFEALYEEPLIAAVPRSSVLGTKASVSLRELAGYPVVATPGRNLRPVSPSVQEAFDRHGLSPEFVECEGPIRSQFTMVEAGACVILCSESFRFLRPRGVKFLSISDPVPNIQLGLTTVGPSKPCVEIIRDVSTSTCAEVRKANRQHERALKISTRTKLFSLPQREAGCVSLQQPMRGGRFLRQSYPVGSAEPSSR